MPCPKRISRIVNSLVIACAMGVGVTAAQPAAATGETPALCLATSGKTDYPIVVEPDALASERTAARELARYLSKVTGTPFVVTTEAPDHGPCIVVGQTAAVRALLPEVAWETLGCDGIVIQARNSRLILAGGRPRGSLYAVYTFLQDMAGCRWYANDAAEVVPRKSTLSVAHPHVLYRPPFDLRQLYTLAVVSKTDSLFSVKLRLNPADLPEESGGGVSFGGAHTLPTLVPAKQWFESHADWFALDGSKRVPDNLCYMSDGARKAAAERVLQQLSLEYPKWKYLPKMISVSAPDSGLHCRCEKCVAVLEREGSDSGALIDFVNYVAERVERQYPDVLISTLAYWNTAAPPRHVKPRKNVLVQFAISNEGFHPADKRDRVVQRDFRLPFAQVAVFNQYLDEWHQRASHLYVWDYDTNFVNMVQPHPTYFAFPISLGFYREHGVTGVFSQGSWTSSGDFPQMKAWVNAQMLWNPAQDVRALMREFLNAYYGAAAPYLMEYLELMNGQKGRLGPYENCTRNWLGLADLNRATALFQQASRAVAADELLSFRVRRTRLSLDIVWLQQYRELRREARRLGLPFAGPDDPYAEVERIARDEFQTGAYAEWITFDKYIALLRKLFPKRAGQTPAECQGLKPYQWEEVQDDLFTATPSECMQLIDDPKASNGRSLRLKPITSGSQASYEIPQVISGIPTHLAGRYRIYAVVRVESTGGSPSVVTLGISKGDVRVEAVFAGANACEFRTIDLGTHELSAGAKIWIRADGEVRSKTGQAVYVDRLLLITAE
jgi:hypothetical protein